MSNVSAPRLYGWMGKQEAKATVQPPFAIWADGRFCVVCRRRVLNLDDDLGDVCDRRTDLYLVDMRVR